MVPDIDEPSPEELSAIIREQANERLLEELGVPAHARSAAPFADVELVVCSAVEAIDFVSDQRWACISIDSQEGGWPELSKQNRVALLQLAFNDVECSVNSRLGRSFSSSDAQQVIDFVLEYSPRVSTLLIHCERGESRSVGIAAAIAHLFGKDVHDFEENGLRPNHLVFSLIRENLPPPEQEYDYEQLLGLDQEWPFEDWS